MRQKYERETIYAKQYIVGDPSYCRQIKSTLTCKDISTSII